MTVIVHPTAGMVQSSSYANSNDASVAVPPIGTPNVGQHQVDSDDGDTSYLEAQPGVGGGEVSFALGLFSGVSIGGDLIGSGNPLPSGVDLTQAYVRVVAKATNGAPAYFFAELVAVTSTVGLSGNYAVAAAESQVPGGSYTEVRIPFTFCPADIDESGSASLYRLWLWPRPNGDRGTNWIRVTELAVVVPSGLPPLRQYPRDDAIGGQPRQGHLSRSVQASNRQGWRGTYR